MSLNSFSNIYYNIYFNIRELLKTYIPTVAVETEFPKSRKQLVLPTVAISYPDIISTPLQLGGGAWRSYDFYIDVFASTSIMRDDLSSIIMNNFENSGISLIDYSDKTINSVTVSNYPYNPPTSLIANANYDSTITAGYADFTNAKSVVIDLDNIEDLNLYRRNINFTATVAYD